jgi:DNA-binding transcriptional LysR family regulator
MKDPRFAEHLSVFVDVVRAGSFSGASRRRNVTPSAIVRQVDALESALGTTLLVRSTRALVLTDAGRVMFERARPILDELVDLQAEISGLEEGVVGSLRIACLPTFGKRYVVPVAADLMVRFPDLRIDLDLTERIADPIPERLDAVIRIGDLQDSTLIASRLASQRRLLVAAPDYLNAHGAPRRDDIGAHRLLDKIHGSDQLGWRDVIGCPLADLPQPGSVFRCDDFEALRQAALRGMGIGLLPDWVVGADVRDGGLVRIPVEVASPGGDVAIHVLRALAKPPAKFRVFVKALRDHIGSPPIWRHEATAR